jgi:hypothetical protein
MRLEVWTDDHEEPNSHFSEICAGPNIVHFVARLRIHKARTYVRL